MNADILSKECLHEICRVYQIGEILSQPQACTGGLVHQTFSFQTTQGGFVLKILNASVISQSQKIDTYRKTEQIAREFEKYIPAIPALLQHQDPLFKFHENRLMLFKQVEAKTLSPNQINNSHIIQIAISIAKMHEVNLSIPNAPDNILLSFGVLNNEVRLNQAMQKTPEITSLLEKNLNDIHIFSREYQKIISILKQDLIISHRDCDPKNVLWDKTDSHFIIDWEAAGWINKTRDVISTALYWSIDEEFNINDSALTIFLETYQNNFPTFKRTELEAGIFGFLGDWLGWLDFCLTRIIDNDIGTDEYKIGITEAKKTLTGFPILLSWWITTKNV